MRWLALAGMFILSTCGAVLVWRSLHNPLLRVAAVAAVGAVAVATMVAVVASFGLHDLASPHLLTSAQLARMPEGHLLYPGSTNVRTFAQDQQVGGTGHPASINTEATVVASIPTILAWYRQSLSAFGWRERPSDGTALFFTRDDREFVLTTIPRAPLTDSAAVHALSYAVSLVEPSQS